MSPCNARRLNRGDCPSEWLTAQFAAVADVVLPEETLAAPPDTDFTFFRDIMLFSDEEIEKVTQDAINFFYTMYGLDFSQLSAEGVRTFENATLLPYVMSPDVRYTITVNSWLLSGRSRNTCFENRDGGLGVQFTGEQILHGTYGGEAGILAHPGDSVVYGFYNIPVCPQQPIVIQYQSNTPFRLEPFDNFGIINCGLYHRVLGAGSAQGVFRAVPTGDPGMVHLTIRNTFTFPAHPGLN